MIYLDNAATTFPKPYGVTGEMTAAMTSYGANPGRSGHRLSMAAAEKVFSVREKAAEMFGCCEQNVIFTANATQSINMALKGFLKPGDHVITTMFDHNAVIRPLYAQKSRNVATTVLPFMESDDEFIELLLKSIRQETKLMVLNHVSNVFGTALPLEKLCAVAKERKIAVLLDASQSAGTFDIKMEKLGIDMLCTAGHKGLYGPMGTGLLCLKDGLVLETLLEGGTGNLSANLSMPDEPPERYEAGTLNLPGIAGLGAGIDYVKKRTSAAILAEEKRLCGAAKAALSKIEGVTVYFPDRTDSGVFSFNIDGMCCNETAEKLDARGILVRPGYHCAYLAHKCMGTLQGTVRASFGAFSLYSDARALVHAVSDIVRSEIPKDS